MASDTKRIFLASSAELRTDRDAFRLFVGDLNKRWHERGIFLDVPVWEDFDDAMSPTRKQDDYNAALRECDLFVMLYWTKVGKYTREEFEAAQAQFKATGRPLVYTYCKDVAIPTSAVNRRDMNSLLDFKERLEALEHFPTSYDSVAALTRHFGEQLEKLALEGFFGTIPGPETAASLAAGAPSNTATLHGSGAIAQGAGAQAVGASGVLIGGNNSGSINTGTIHTGGAMFLGPVNAGRDVVGGNQTVHQASAVAPTPSVPAPATGDWQQFAGVLKDSPNWNGDPQAVQEAMRREWD